MALADMAVFSNDKAVSLRDISLRQGISLLYLEQIFLRLKKNNIVKSVRGINGGYILVKSPKELKLIVNLTNLVGYIYTSLKYRIYAVKY